MVQNYLDKMVFRMSTQPFSLSKSCVQKFVDLKFTKGDAAFVLQSWKGEEWWRIDSQRNFDVSLLDEDKMMTHLLDCYAALCAAQQFRVQNKKPSKLNAKTQQAKNKVFKTAMSLMSTGLTHDGAESPEYTTAFSKMVIVFPDDSKMKPNEGSSAQLTVDEERPVNWIPAEGRGWMPLHWATTALNSTEGDFHGLTEEDVKLVCSCDPFALSRHHFPLDDYPDGCTPAHFLCMQPVTKCRMSLLAFFSTYNQQALVSSDTQIYSSSNYRTHLSLLHVACEYGQPTEELLQFLLQLEISQVRDAGNAYYPLGSLCKNSKCNERSMKCLLDADSSAIVVGSGIRACIESTDHSNTSDKVDVLLKANPEAAKYCGNEDDDQLEYLLESANKSTMPPDLCIEVMKRILAVYPDAVKQAARYTNELPVHTAAQHGSLVAMEFLLGVYPESATMMYPYRNPEDDPYNDDDLEGWFQEKKNLLHLALSCTDAGVVETKVRYLCSRYPEMLSQRGGDGNTPFIQAISNVDSAEKLSIVRLLCDIGGGPELVKIPSIHPIGADTIWLVAATGMPLKGPAKHDQWLPLHFYVASRALVDRSPVSEFADFFRLMLSWYPEAAGVEGIYEGLSGDDPDKKNTPYQLAVEKDLDPYYIRLLLRAAPNHNPAELHRRNWEERRTGTFLAFRAIPAEPSPLFLARLRFENKDLVKHVVSFL